MCGIPNDLTCEHFGSSQFTCVFINNTIRSYSNTFSLLLTFMEEVKNIEAERLVLDHFNRTTILDFWDWLQTEKQN